ncbi:MAG: Xaa-Pro peptidase family protein [Clostridia bacterium]|nr:Xaa-Pro peptidase family protein [Clostridia bacterium]
MYEKRIQRLRGSMRTKNLSAVLLSSFENRFYYSGFSGASGAMLITEQSAYLFVDSRFLAQAEAEAKGCKTVLIQPSLYETLNSKLSLEHVARMLYEDKEFSVYQFEAFKNNIVVSDLVAGSDMLARIRSVKDEDEIEIMSRGAHLCDEAFSYILSKVRAGATEKELLLDLEVFLKRNGAQKVFESSRILTGIRSASMYFESSNAEITDGDILLIDFAVRYENYCIKMARSVAVKIADDRMREIYSILFYAQAKSLNLLKSATSLCEANQQMKDNMASFGYGDSFYGVYENGVGIADSEFPNLRDSKTILLKGNVLCVAPAILVSDYGGMKIADTVVVGDEGGVSLTNSPRELLTV